MGSHRPRPRPISFLLSITSIITLLPTFLLPTLLTLNPRLTEAALTNITVDDTDLSKISYVSKGDFAWKVGQSCGNCALKPDKTAFLNGSWHDGFAENTNDKQIRLQFKGVFLLHSLSLRYFLSVFSFPSLAFPSHSILTNSQASPYTST